MTHGLRQRVATVVAVGCWLFSTGAWATDPKVEVVARGLDVPWSLAFLPDGAMLVTERPGRMRVVSPDGRIGAPIAGVPRVHAQGQGGLFDVALSPNFAEDRTVFFAFAEPTRGGARTAVARAVFEREANRLTKVQGIFAQNEDPPGGGHFGGRLAFAPDGTLFVTLGERYAYRDKAQEPGSLLGKIVRINPDGSVPANNPFADSAVFRPEIWSYGHRNVQGAAIHPRTGRLWTHEHGPQGGDEVNIPRAGRNHGWPVITYGREYVTGFAIGEGTTREDVVAPVQVWIPSIAPSGMAFYTGELFPRWQGNLFVGSLKFGVLVRLELDGDKVVREERLLEGVTRRIRDVRQGPDGALYLLDEGGGRILRVVPGQ
ncbi:PQQ-dependent sugar dehydrogenase [Nitrogeniibacter mangrovi]|uniref:PQQ-dependent sugar dehydrogenase n=1 Tax=Nitrogeniibacter mangrovi TaxID=2016596 RepID=A0A6C1B2X5_9RHOO|nr:PQQ-dependent sugar dehydrogenase [Nitrogeniibacter mangrovi]QID18002.1 PQQ-dependent sugar dehydrogenase [Nitrogeniibacter mangrovi]